MLGVCYYPEHWPENVWRDDAKEMRQLGLTYVRVGEFSWSRLEPEPGTYDFDWLDNAISILAHEGLKIVIGTPTATPPKWLVDKYPEVLPLDPLSGRVRGFGSRRHYDFSSDVYLNESLRITRALVKHYATHPAVVGWQTDNELACHDTCHSGSANAKTAFQKWCERRYHSIDELNRAWGNVFWSMEYRSFSEIELPLAAVTETSPGHSLAYRRFSSDQVVRFHTKMVECIRELSPDTFITHNFIPTCDTNVDNFALAAPLDFTSYDNYPLGRTDLAFANQDTSDFEKYMRTGHPDYACFFHDQIRGLSRGGYWVMEQQPGPVNWALHNPRPAAGMVRLWTWEAFAHGADCVSYFRWRQAPFAQEQMHSGLLRSDNSKAAVWSEIVQVEKEIKQINITAEENHVSEVAILIDIEGQWLSDVEKQGAGYDFWQVQFAYYSALRALGLNVDYIGKSADFSDYTVIVVPSLPEISSELVRKIRESDATFIFGPRCGAKNEEFSAPENLAPGHLQELLAIKILSIDTTRPDCGETLTWQAKRYTSHSWREEISIQNNDDGKAEIDKRGIVETVARYADDSPAVVKLGSLFYIGTLSDQKFLEDFFAQLCKDRNIVMTPVQEDLRLRKRGRYFFAFNYSTEPKKFTLPVGATVLLGSENIPAHDLLVWTVV